MGKSRASKLTVIIAKAVYIPLGCSLGNWGNLSFTLKTVVSSSLLSFRSGWLNILFCQTGQIFEFLFSKDESWRTVLLCSLLISWNSQRARCKMTTKISKSIFRTISVSLEMAMAVVGCCQIALAGSSKPSFPGMANIPCVPEYSMFKNLCCFFWTICMGILLGCCHIMIKFWKTFNPLSEVDVNNASIYQNKKRLLQLGPENSFKKNEAFLSLLSLVT